MESRVGTLIIQLSGAIAITIACLVFLPATIAAQVGNASKVQMQEMDKRELQLSDLSKGNNKESDPKRAQAVKDQINEDFLRILKLHNEMVQVITADRPLDYQVISLATSEINRRAIRLRSTLALQTVESPAQDSKHDSSTADIETRDSLIKLCRKIELFVKNPIIDTPGTVDAKQLENARRDLDTVVELSGAIKRDAQKKKKLH